MRRSTKLTLAEKAALTSGAGAWSTKAFGGIPSVTVSDGPHGLRKQVDPSPGETSDGDPDLGLSPSKPATCFPPAAGLAQSWDPALIERVGVALGEECRAEGVNILLGPGINIKRSPLGGRNFEYYSEDPMLTGMLASAWVTGLQSQGVGASLKHFAANNAEHDRMRLSSDMDPRTLREIYLRAFQRVVRDAHPWTVMCSYNRINGVLASQNRLLLTDILRGEWGFDGLVVSDWGAVADRAAAVAAGVDLTMPFPGPGSDAELLAAVEGGEVGESVLDVAVGRLAALADKAVAGSGTARIGAAGGVAADSRCDRGYDVDGHHSLAREAASRSIALLQNDRGLLPLSPAGSLAVIGAFAAEPRYQGGGSSHVTPTRLITPLEAIQASAAGAVTYTQGFTVDGSGADAELVADAVAAARSADTAVLFLGLADRQESEGYDRTTIDLPAEQLELAQAVVAANPRTVAVLAHGGVLRLAPLAEAIPAILDGALLGQAGGEATADVLFGVVNPSGRLSETVPVRIQDTPAYLNFPGEFSHVLYGEGIFVGYRWYDARQIAVTYPFGHGLSYTTFGYAGLRLASGEDGIEVRVTVTNTGDRAGREIVQVYAGLPGSSVARPARWLAGFAAADLEPGASQEVAVRVQRDDLAYWDRRVRRFVVEGGAYEVSVGASSRDIRLTARADVTGDALVVPLTLDSTLAEVAAHPVAGPLLAERFPAVFPAPGGDDATLGVSLFDLISASPVGRMVSFSRGTVTREMLRQLLDAANETAR
jgi:beta-glucosidase